MGIECSSAYRFHTVICGSGVTHNDTRRFVSIRFGTTAQDSRHLSSRVITNYRRPDRSFPSAGKFFLWRSCIRHEARFPQAACGIAGRSGNSAVVVSGVTGFCFISDRVTKNPMNAAAAIMVYIHK